MLVHQRYLQFFFWGGGVAGNQWYAWVERDNVELSFLSEETKWPSRDQPNLEPLTLWSSICTHQQLQHCLSKLTLWVSHRKSLRFDYVYLALLCKDDTIKYFTEQTYKYVSVRLVFLKKMAGGLGPSPSAVNGSHSFSLPIGLCSEISITVECCLSSTKHYSGTPINM